MNVNQVTVAGNLVRDPDLRYTGKGTPVCEATIAINRRWRSDSGEQKESTTFVGLVIWGKRGEAFAEHLKKGRPVFCTGRITQDTWQDKTTGQKRERTKVEVDDWQFCGGQGPGTPQGPAASEPKRPAKAPEASVGPATPPEDDDVPF